MKHLKTFESFSDMDMGRFSGSNPEEQVLLNKIREEEEELEEEEVECNCGSKDCSSCKEKEDCSSCKGEEDVMRKKVWGDEVIEKKKFNFEKKSSKKEDKKDPNGKESKGLSKAQSKLPEGLRKAIEAKNNKKK